MPVVIRMIAKLAALIALIVANSAWSADVPETPAISEFLVRYQDDARSLVADSVAAQRAQDLGTPLGETLTPVRSAHDGAHVLRADRKLTRAEAWELANRMMRRPGVRDATPIDPDFDARPPARPSVQVEGRP